MQKPIRIFSLIIIALHTPQLLAEDLLALYQLAQQNDPNVKSAQLQVELGEAQEGQALGAMLPQVTANINVSANQQSINAVSSTYNGQRYGVGLTQSLVDLPKWMNWQRYQNIVDQYQANNEEAQQLLMFNIVDRYFTVLEARDTLKLIEQEMQSTERQLMQEKSRLEKQMAMVTNVYELEAKFDALAAEKIAAQTQIDIALQSVVELTGQPIQNLANLRNDIEFVTLQGDIDTWVQQAEQENPGINAQEKAIAAADAQVWQQKARHLPTVDVQLNYLNTNTGYQNNLTPTIDTQVAALNVTVPIFSGGVTSRAADEAAKSLEINKQKRIALIRALVKDTRDSFLSTNANVKRISAAEKALQSSTKAREAMEKGFEYGMQTIGDILVSEEREFKAKREILQAKYAYIKSRARFARVTGMINEAYLQTINQWLSAGQAALAQAPRLNN